jgi:hypothetical protein
MNRENIRKNLGNGGHTHDGGPEYGRKRENGDDFSNRSRRDVPGHLKHSSDGGLGSDTVLAVLG